jgi:hypothetical protein
MEFPTKEVGRMWQLAMTEEVGRNGCLSLLPQARMQPVCMADGHAQYVDGGWFFPHSRISFRLSLIRRRPAQVANSGPNRQQRSGII